MTDIYSVGLSTLDAKGLNLARKQIPCGNQNLATIYAEMHIKIFIGNYYYYYNNIK